MTELSIIMPFFKKYHQWKNVLPLNYKYLQNINYEVLVILDDPSDEKKVYKLISTYDKVQWVILVNRQIHSWRPPCIPINVGIKNSNSDYILVVSPESIFATDVPNILLNSTKNASKKISCGYLKHVIEKDLNEEYLKDIESTNKKWFGSVCFNKKDAEEIAGYDESLTNWGGDDDNFRIRMCLNGCSLNYCNNACVFHYKLNNETSSKDLHKYKDPQKLQEILKPKKIKVNSNTWGLYSFETTFNYKKNVYISKNKIDTSKIIILGSARTGTHHLAGILSNKNNDYGLFGEISLRKFFPNNIKATYCDLSNLLHLCSCINGKISVIIHKSHLMQKFGEIDPENWIKIIKDYFGNCIYVRTTKSAIDSAVSLYFADCQSFWSFKTEEEKALQKIPEYNYSKIFGCLKHLVETRWTIEDKEYLKAYDINYEDLCINPKNIIDKFSKNFELNLIDYDNNLYKKQEDINKDLYSNIFCEELSVKMNLSKDLIKKMDLDEIITVIDLGDKK